jgi:hypothetical protein
VAIDHSTASGGDCAPAHGPAAARHHAAGRGPELAFTGIEALQAALAGAFAVALGSLFLAIGSPVSRRTA